MRSVNTTFIRIAHYQNRIRSLSEQDLNECFASLNIDTKRHVFARYLSEFKKTDTLQTYFPSAHRNSFISNRSRSKYQQMHPQASKTDLSVLGELELALHPFVKHAHNQSQLALNEKDNRQNIFCNLPLEIGSEIMSYSTTRARLKKHILVCKRFFKFGANESTKNTLSITCTLMKYVVCGMLEISQLYNYKRVQIDFVLYADCQRRCEAKRREIRYIEILSEILMHSRKRNTELVFNAHGRFSNEWSPSTAAWKRRMGTSNRSYFMRFIHMFNIVSTAVVAESAQDTIVAQRETQFQAIIDFVRTFNVRGMHLRVLNTADLVVLWRVCTALNFEAFYITQPEVFHFWPPYRRIFLRLDMVSAKGTPAVKRIETMQMNQITPGFHPLRCIHSLANLERLSISFKSIDAHGAYYLGLLATPSATAATQRLVFPVLSFLSLSFTVYCFRVPVFDVNAIDLVCQQMLILAPSCIHYRLGIAFAPERANNNNDTLFDANQFEHLKSGQNIQQLQSFGIFAANKFEKEFFSAMRKNELRFENLNSFESNMISVQIDESATTDLTIKLCDVRALAKHEHDVWHWLQLFVSTTLNANKCAVCKSLTMVWEDTNFVEVANSIQTNMGITDDEQPFIPFLHQIEQISFKSFKPRWPWPQTSDKLNFPQYILQSMLIRQLKNLKTIHILAGCPLYFLSVCDAITAKNAATNIVQNVTDLTTNYAITSVHMQGIVLSSQAFKFLKFWYSQPFGEIEFKIREPPRKNFTSFTYLDVKLNQSRIE